MPPRTEIVGILTLMAPPPDFVVHADIFVEDFKGLTVLKIKAVGAKTVARSEP